MENKNTTFVIALEADRDKISTSGPFGSEIVVTIGYTVDNYPVAYTVSPLVENVYGIENNLQPTVCAAFNGCTANADDGNAFILSVSIPVSTTFNTMLNNKSIASPERDMLITAEIVRQNSYSVTVCVSKMSTTAIRDYLHNCSDYQIREL